MLCEIIQCSNIRQTDNMKYQIAILLFCAVAWSEGHKYGRQGENDEECCYPKPPPRKERGFKRHASECCEVPVTEIWEQFSSDLEKCKEENKKKPEEQSTTTTTAPPSEKENEFDAEPSDSMENDDADEAVPTTTLPTSTESNHQGRHHEFHKGRKGGKHHHHGHRGKCMRETMEKHGWSNNGTINWEAMKKDTEKATKESVQMWVDVVTKAIQNCSEQAAKAPAPPADTTNKHHGHHCSAEKQAWRCVINSSIMNCPYFPENNEYCVKLREVYQKCSELPYGKHVKWCKSGKKKNQQPQPQPEA